MSTIVSAVVGIATGFSILAGLVLLAKLWHEPRFVSGILPAREGEMFRLSSRTNRGTAQRVKYRQQAMTQPRDYKRESLGTLVLPVLLQNQGHGIARSLTVNIEFDTDALEILDIWTEVMKVNAILGNANNISSKLKDVVADRHICDAYSQIGPGGTYIQLVGSFPAAAVEIFVVKVRVKKPMEIYVTIRMQTPERVFQQKTVRQKLTIT